MKRVFVISQLIVMLLATGCAASPSIAAGEIIPISTESTLWIMRGALNGAQNTSLLQNGDQWLFIRNLGVDGYGFVNLGANGNGGLSPSLFRMASGGNGNLVSAQTMTEFMDWLKQQGWQPATSGAMGETLRMSILESAVWQISNTSFTWAMFFVPVTMQDVDSYLEREQAIQ